MSAASELACTWYILGPNGAAITRAGTCPACARVHMAACRHVPGSEAC